MYVLAARNTENQVVKGRSYTTWKDHRFCKNNLQQSLVEESLI